MPRRSASEPLPPTCPLCGAAQVTVVGHEGIDGRLTLLRCEACGRTWSELITSAPAGADDDTP